MIKCNVTVCGTVSKAATCRTNKEGKAFVSFAMNVVIPAKSGINKTIEVSVIKDGTLTEVGSCNIGERIEVAPKNLFSGVSALPPLIPNEMITPMNSLKLVRI